ncbi:MAG: hypothetical protein ACRD3T_12660 [Terriglobia bacterium]
MKSIVIISPDWRFRALLRAQLLEEGFGVRAGNCVADLPELTNGHSADPDLLVADLGGFAGAENEENDLMQCARRSPLWIVAPAEHPGANALAARLRAVAEQVFSRPLDLGEFVECIKKRLMPVENEHVEHP